MAAMAAFGRDVDLKPIRQGDFDGLCTVYSVLNALQWLLPKARDVTYLTGLFEKIIGPVYTIKQVRDGAEEPELLKVFRFVQKQVAADFNVDIELTVLADGEANFKRPDQAIQSMFGQSDDGVILFGFEGLDSHWTVARGVTTDEVILFDSWEYVTFDRRKFVWASRVKDISKSSRIVVAPTDLNWISMRR
jgi:hypothetical protein